jgi:CheY-like chemotaxis protein
MSILIVDDQEHCIDLLMSLLQTAVDGRMAIDYVSSSLDVIGVMEDLLKGEGQPYQALITDFNMDGVNGKQLLQVIAGRLEGLNAPVSVSALHSFADVEDQTLREHVQDNFSDVHQYREFCARHELLVKILFSGEQFGDGSDDLPDDIPFVLKTTGAELRISEILHEAEILTDQEWSRACRYWKRAVRK